jgi:hypothetical protein
MVAFDASILLFVLSPIPPPSSVPNAKDRVEYLIDTLTEQGETIIVPTPALSECLVHAGDAGSDYVTILTKQACFRIASFDTRAAVEAAAQTFAARVRGHVRGGPADIAKAKIKFDRQIVAIAKVERASAMYSDDKHVVAYAIAEGMQGYRLGDLPLPPEPPQISLPL